ncbi:MAG: 4-hydroxy-2-oxoheptanedioate aldolase [Alphaproteobacteria bacterium]|nr:4-hydroxy-2-oxoheptanedioate aldolase [Alphaproteobacteria bacterium]
MPAPFNAFKKALKEGKPQIGFWLALASPYSAELCAGAGYDFLVFDGEHAPNDVPVMLSQLQAVAPYGAAPVARPQVGETWLIKQYLDIGAQNILVPIVETREQAQQLVSAVRYPPRGVRGVATLTRASRFGHIPDYLATADEQICLMLQVETQKGLANLDEIISVDGVDGVFIGPSDTAAACGHLGNPGHADVQKVIEDALVHIRKAGKAPGVLMVNEELARRYLELGALFVAVGTDVGILIQGAQGLAQRFGVKRPPV